MKLLLAALHSIPIKSFTKTLLRQRMLEENAHSAAASLPIQRYRPLFSHQYTLTALHFSAHCARKCAIKPWQLRMNSALMNRFSSFANEEGLRAAIHTICADFGQVRTLRIFTVRDDEGTPRCLCMLQLVSPEAEGALRARLDVFEYGTSLAFWVDVNKAWMNNPLTS